MHINAISRQLILVWLNERMHNAIDEDDGLRKRIGIFNSYYISQNLTWLHYLEHASTYKPHKMKAQLDDRNNYWLKQVPNLIKQQWVFGAVGALRLPGQLGLVQQLRSRGQSISGVNLKHP